VSCPKDNSSFESSFLTLKMNKQEVIQGNIIRIRELRREKEGDEIICQREINQNINRIMTNQPLTRPLRVLNRSCEFRKKYEEIFNFANEDKIKEEVKAKKREYYQKPEVKAKQREYYQKPEVKAKKREYYQKPEVKAKKREYYQKPEVKAKQREYYQKPEVKARQREYRKRLNILKSRWKIKTHSKKH
jgi:hypothetical protein